MTPTPSDAQPDISRADALREARAAIVARPGLVGVALRDALADAYDQWLTAALPERSGVALVAVGGLGRREMAPYSDLDLMLLYTKGTQDVAAIADAIWYPVWDSRIGLDHSVRTPGQAVSVVAEDMKAMLGLLDLRHIAGDAGLSGELHERTFALWRSTAPKRIGELRELCRNRGKLVGEVGFALEPEMKQGRGGLRDWHALRALAMAQLVDVRDPVRRAGELLLDVRGELQRVNRGPDDVLRLQDQQPVAAALGLNGDDGLLRAVNEAGRTISSALERAWRQIPVGGRPRGRPRSWGVGLGRPASAGGHGRQPVAQNVISQAGEIVLARSADPRTDPVLPLRAARAAATRGEPLAPFTLDRLVSETAPMPEPWPEEARGEFLALLGTGASAVPVLEALDQAGLMSRLFPEWEHVRFAPQHNPVHRFTVERHLMETAAEAAALTAEVRRPDLLLTGALFHDIGKGLPGDHSVVGAGLARPIATRMGFPPDDVHRVITLVRHHLLLVDTATRRDLDDPRTIGIVVDGLDGSSEMLDELAALSRADAAATGPAAWSGWKARLLAELVRRAKAVMTGGELPFEPTELAASRDRLAAQGELGELEVERVGDRLIVTAPDVPGLLSATSGVLALHSLEVRAATVATQGCMAVNSFVAAPRFGSYPHLATLRNDLTRALEGSLPLDERLSAKDAAYADRLAFAGPPPRVLWFNDEATDAIIVEIRASDSFGLLRRLTGALEASKLDIRSAQISTLGRSVIDAFYVTSGDGEINDDLREAATRRLLLAAR